MEESLSVLRSLKTSKATYALVARVSRGTRRALWTRSMQSWSQVVMFGKFYGWQSYEHIFCRRVLLSHFWSVWKGKTKLTSLLYFIRSGLLQTNQSVGLMGTQAIGKANNNTVLFLFKSTASEQVVCSKHRVSKRITRHYLKFLSFHSFQTQFIFKCWKQCTWYDKYSLRNRKRAFHGCPESRSRR